MQAPPALSLAVSHFGAWRVLCLTLTLVSVAAASAWAVSREDAVSFAVLLPVLLFAVLSGGCRRPAPFHLRWDTQAWHVDGQAGVLAIAIDAGDAFLLRFVPEGARHARWLPVQRPGHEAAWHALRCTLHGGRPLNASHEQP
jgi:hypothetical protein